MAEFYRKRKKVCMMCTGKKVDYKVVLIILVQYFFGTKVPVPTHINFTKP